MYKLDAPLGRAIAMAAALTALATPLGAQDRLDWGGGRSGERDYDLAGAGVPRLLPELRRTNRGRAFVMRNFDDNDDGRISPREADAANRAFLRLAGGRRDRFDWESRDAGRPSAGHRDWDRRGMRDYHMRQTRYGATFDLQDVLFETGSAALRRTALERLRPLAGYLEANPEVEVRIDGHTDSVGSEASNQLLSERRAESVRAALRDMGLERGRFRIEGHGETSPAATNDTAAGRQLNRRVEVTLVGQRARDFSE
jgi:outer membrane protein OmpA-like peptidoglycan-associated protein